MLSVTELCSALLGVVCRSEHDADYGGCGGSGGSRHYSFDCGGSDRGCSERGGVERGCGDRDCVHCYGVHRDIHRYGVDRDGVHLDSVYLSGCGSGSRYGDDDDADSRINTSL